MSIWLTTCKLHFRNKSYDLQRICFNRTLVIQIHTGKYAQWAIMTASSFATCSLILHNHKDAMSNKNTCFICVAKKKSNCNRRGLEVTLQSSVIRHTHTKWHCSHPSFATHTHKVTLQSSVICHTHKVTLQSSVIRHTHTKWHCSHPSFATHTQSDTAVIRHLPHTRIIIHTLICDCLTDS